MKRYSAKLLFQYCDKENGKPITKRRLCEERIVTFKAKSAKDALSIAKQKGRSAKYNFQNVSNTKTYVEFIGVKELLCLETKCLDDEVWYEYRDMIEPMERKASLIPPPKALEAIKMNE